MRAWLVVAFVLGAALAAGAASPFPLPPGRVTAVFIPKTEPTALYVRLRDGATRRVLTVSQLPRTSREGLGVGARRFVDAALAPDAGRVAFSTLGTVHGWCGLLDLRNGRVRELMLLFEGHAEELAWSPAGRHLAWTDHGPSGVLQATVYDTGTAKLLARLMSVLEKRFFEQDLETYRPGWSRDGKWFRFVSRQMGAGSDVPPAAWQIRPDGTGLRRLHR